MRITEIQVRSFGIWRDATFRLDAPLTCFYGPNEAGKSTLMGFIRSVLFGFPTRARLAERFEPLHGGAHGGMLILVDAQGRRFRIERSDSGVNPNGRARSAAGIVQVTCDDGTSGGEAKLQQLLGGITAELFRSLFAFSLSELQEIRSLQSDEISAYLFSAGFGAGGHTIMQAERRLTAEMEQLYKPKGSRQEINLLLKQMEENAQDIRKNKENIGQFNQNLNEISTMEDTLVV
ncbi:MAG TPA: AAA family ATPase, partial [Bacilli bacterium]